MRPRAQGHIPKIAARVGAADLRRIATLVVISDTHIGCKMGLCWPQGFSLDQGGIYRPSRLQRVVWSWWEEFWLQWVPVATDRQPYVIVLNGDSIEGQHHEASTPITANISDQRRFGEEMLPKWFAKAEGLFVIRGTPSHVGESAQNEEALAKSLNACPNCERQYARFELWKQTGRHLAHFLHHIGTTSSSTHEASAVNAELTAEFSEAARWSRQPPRLVIRSHRHRAMEVRIPVGNGYATAAVTACWQLKTPHTFRIAGARLAPPQIGGMVCRLDKFGNPFTQQYVHHIEPNEPE